MLSAMRRLSKSWIIKALMSLLVVSFAIWGIGDMFRGNPLAREVARVGARGVTVQDLTLEFQRSLPQARQQFGANLTAAKARQMGLLDQTLGTLVEQTAFDQEASRLGLLVGPDVVLASLARVSEFRNKQGKFDNALFQQVLRKMGMTEKDFIERERLNAARRILLTALYSGVSAPRVMIDNLYQARGSKRILEIVSLRNDSVGKEQTPDDAALKAYYEAHTQAFVAPERRRMTVAVLASEEIAQDVTISKEEARAAYDANASAYIVPQRRDLVQIVVQDEAKARELFKKAAAKKNLSSAAKEEGQTAIVMKKVDEKTLLPELYTTVFGAQEGDIAPPVKSGLGWHVVQISRVYEGGPQPFDDARESIEEALRKEKVGELVARVVNRLDEALGAETPLEEVADSLRLRLVRVGALGSDGKAVDGKKAEGIPAYDEAVRAAFAQDSGQTSQIIEDGHGRYLVVRTDEVTPSHTLSFDEVKPRLVALALEEKFAEKAAKEAEKMAEDMRKGKKATAYASMPGVDVRLSSPISLLGDVDKELIPTAIQHVFIMKKGDVVALSGPGRQYIIRLADIVPVDPQKPEPSRLKVVEDLSDVLPLEIISQYSDYVKKIFPVHVDADILTSLRERNDDVGL